MTTTFNGKKITIPDEIISNYMKKLELTKEQAIATYLDDEGYTENTEVEEMTKQAKINKTVAPRERKKETKPRNRKPTENPLKSSIINYLYNILSKNNTITNLKIDNPTKIITFTTEGKQFKIDLIQKREKKG